MNAYFFKMSQDEKNNILDQHKHLYDGYVTKYNQESNQYPIYVQDLANDKNGVTLGNNGTVKGYTNLRITESPLDRIADNPSDLKNGTVDMDSIEDTLNSNTNFMHDVLPSPNEDETEYQTFGVFNDEMKNNLNQYEFDIDELEDYSAEQVDEDFDTSEEDYEETNETNFAHLTDNIDEEELPDVLMNIKESLDMFQRFTKYN